MASCRVQKLNAVLLYEDSKSTSCTMSSLTQTVKTIYINTSGYTCMCMHTKCNVNKYLNMQQIAQRFTCISSIMDHQPSQAGQPGCRMGRAGMAVCRARKERRGSGKSSSKSSAVGWRTSTEVFSPRQDVRPYQAVIIWLALAGNEGMNPHITYII